MNRRGKYSIQVTCALLLALVYVGDPKDAAAQKLYWADARSDSISRSNLDGSGVEQVVKDVGDASLTSLAIHSEAGHLYWTEIVGVSPSIVGRIRRADLDGGNPETLLEVPGEAMYSLAIDAGGGHMYWSTPTIRRANLDGSNATTLVPRSQPPSTMTLDLQGGHIYWAQWATIYRSALDGSNVETLNDPLLNVDYFSGLLFDTTSGNLYFVAALWGWGYSGYEIRRWIPNGPEAERLEPSPYLMRSPTLDTFSQSMFWIAEEYSWGDTRRRIRQSDFGGCDTQDVIGEGLEEPVDLAIDLTARPSIDLAPGVCPDDLTDERRAFTQVAIFGTASFNPRDIDPSSLRLVRADGIGGDVLPIGRGSRRLTIEDVGSAAKAACACPSGGPDGVPDAVIRFSTADIRKLVGKADVGSPARIVLQGKLTDGRPLAGVDCVTGPSH